MATLLAASFDGSTSGSTATNTSTNGTVNGTSIIHSNVRSVDSTLSVKFNTTSGQTSWIQYLTSSNSTEWLTFYIFPTANPGANLTLANWFSPGSTQIGSLRWITDGTLNFRDDVTSINTTVALPLNGWSRLSIRCTPGSSTGHQLRGYIGSNYLGSTPDFDIQGTATSASQTAIGQWQIGTISAGTTTYYVDRVLIDDTSEPAVYVVPTVIPPQPFNMKMKQVFRNTPAITGLLLPRVQMGTLDAGDALLATTLERTPYRTKWWNGTYWLDRPVKSTRGSELLNFNTRRGAVLDTSGFFKVNANVNQYTSDSFSGGTSAQLISTSSLTTNFYGGPTDTDDMTVFNSGTTVTFSGMAKFSRTTFTGVRATIDFRAFNLSTLSTVNGPLIDISGGGWIPFYVIGVSTSSLTHRARAYVQAFGSPLSTSDYFLLDNLSLKVGPLQEWTPGGRLRAYTGAAWSS